MWKMLLSIEIGFFSPLFQTNFIVIHFGNGATKAISDLNVDKNLLKSIAEAPRHQFPLVITFNFPTEFYFTLLPWHFCLPGVTRLGEGAVPFTNKETGGKRWRKRDGWADGNSRIWSRFKMLTYLPEKSLPNPSSQCSVLNEFISSWLFLRWDTCAP